MKDTNQVQEALESKAKKELQKNCRRFYGGAYQAG